ncbi:MAG: 16S rRNA (cytosine(967)-C(5))-methyltransferase RsmB [Candidatus Zixiibacteriota bacterium]
MNKETTRQKSGTSQYDPVRAAAVEALILIQQGGQAEDAISSVSSDRGFRPLDIRFIMQLVNGTTKMRRRLDHEIKFYLARPSKDLPLKLTNILRLGFYQLHFTDRIPDAAAVSESVNLARYMTDRSKANLVNAVMRASLRQPEKVIFADRGEDPVKYLGDYYSFPDYFVKYCLSEFGSERTEAALREFNAVPRLTYRVNYLKAKPEEVTEILAKNDVAFAPGNYLPEYIHIEQGGLPLESELIATGKVFIQDESAGLATRLANPRPGGKVLDCAAAPGGKATHMAIRMRNRGRITALDKSHERLRLVLENAERLGIKIISPVVSDMFDFKEEGFDRVMLDPPCSGWGTAGKHADLRWAKSEDDIVHLSRIQSKMILKAAKSVKPGGILIYSTCTIIRAENDQVVEEFLLRRRDFEIDSPRGLVPAELVTSRGFVKTYPALAGIDGAFSARLKRKP